MSSSDKPAGSDVPPLDGPSRGSTESAGEQEQGDEVSSASEAVEPTHIRGTVKMTPEQAAAFRDRAAVPFAASAPQPALSHSEASAAAATTAPDLGESRSLERKARATAKLTDEQAAVARQQAATPFVASALTAPARQAGQPAAGQLRGTAKMSDEQAAALRAQAVIPFVRAATPPECARPDPATPTTRGTAKLDPSQAAALRAVAVMPFVAPADRAPAPALGEAPAPRAGSLRVLNDAPLQPGTFVWELSPGQCHLVVAAKASCTLVPGARAQVHRDGDPLCGDVELVPGGSLGYPSDWAAFKAKADVVLSGHAYAPRGHSPAALVTFSFGHRGNRFSRRVAVFGDRHWQRALLSLAPVDPQPFASMPLTYERAFGGPGFVANPVGVGYEARAGADGIARLPNLEDPDALITSPSDTPTPACFGALPPRWKSPELFDGSWRRHRAPLFPVGFDWRGFQCAPSAQQLAYLRGDEPFECTGMQADGSIVAGTLPGLRVRAFLGWHEPSRRDVEEVAMRLDTAVFDLEDSRLWLVWRGAVAVADAEASDADALLLMAESTDGPRVNVHDARQRLRGEW